MNLYRLLEEKDDHLKLRLYRRGAPLPLSDVLPILENLGLRVVAERAYPVRRVMSCVTGFRNSA
jgi:glutamate dehydrogenase